MARNGADLGIKWQKMSKSEIQNVQTHLELVITLQISRGLQSRMLHCVKNVIINLSASPERTES